MLQADPLISALFDESRLNLVLHFAPLSIYVRPLYIQGSEIREMNMVTMQDREKAFENKYAHDQETKFRVIARRNKLLGLWAAGLLGKSDADAAAYAGEVVASDFEEAGDEDVVRKVAADLKAGGLSQSEDEIRAKLAELLPVAVAQIEAG